MPSNEQQSSFGQSNESSHLTGIEVTLEFIDVVIVLLLLLLLFVVVVFVVVSINTIFIANKAKHKKEIILFILFFILINFICLDCIIYI
jgi:hypothetical protein